MIEFAKKEDVNHIIPLLLDAVGDIAYTLSGTADKAATCQILTDFCMQEDNRISYRHVLVNRKKGEVAGMLLCYAGDAAEEIDQPIIQYLRDKGAAAAADALIVECKLGDFYLDSIAVSPQWQGKGIARELMAAFEQIGAEQKEKRLSLIVEPSNERAFQLYQKQGYLEEERMMVSGSPYIRMIKPLHS